ncbi:hypothetical protein GGU11DRAFT_761665, partial [Lentinula aff. detonsa]
EARLAEIRRKKEEKKKREAEEKKKKEELEKRKAEEAKAAEAAKKAAEKAKREEEEKRKVEEQSRLAESAKRTTGENSEMDRRMETAALVRAQIEKKKNERLVHSPVSEASTVVVGKKRKRTVMVAMPSGDPEGDDPNPGDDGDYNDSDNEDDDPPFSPPKQSRCSRCILKALKCEMVGGGSASCQGCRKAKVRCSLVPDNYPRRSKRAKVESPIALTSSQTIDNLRTNVRDLNTRINLQEEMLWYLILRVRKLKEEKNEEDEEEEESEEERVNRTGDRKGKSRKE